MTQKTRVLNVRVVGFSAPEKQMLNSIFLLSVAPARQIGYKLWNSESGTAPDMYLLDGDSESAVSSWQAAFSNTADRTLVVGAKNSDLGVASAARPLGLKVVGAMDRLSIALNNVAREAALHDATAPRAGGTLPTSPVASRTLPTSSNAGETIPTPQSTAPARPEPPPRVASGMTAQQPALSTSMNAPMSAIAPMSAAASTLSGGNHSMTATHAGTMPTSMTAAAPAATVLPSMNLQPTVAPQFDRTLSEKPVTERAVDKILSDKPTPDKPFSDRPFSEKPVSGSAASLLQSGVTPLSPSALSAAVAPSATRTNLRIVPVSSPMAASLPATTPTVARIADAPMAPPPTAPAPVPVAVAVVVPQVIAPPPPALVPIMPLTTPTPRHEEQVFRVLAVDDSPLMRTFLQNKLSPYGIVPEFAASGEEALFKISKLHFDLIFLDVMLPGMDGYDVCKMIKKNKDNKLMKVVMLTSKDKTFDKIRGTMAGCDGYLTKPVDEMKLRAIIERHTVVRK